MFEFLQESVYENDIDYIDRSFNILSECKSYFDECSYFESCTDDEDFNILYETVADTIRSIIKAIEDFFRKVKESIKNKLSKKVNININAYSPERQHSSMRRKVENLSDIGNKPVSVPDYNTVVKEYSDILNLIMKSKVEDIDPNTSNGVNRYTTAIINFGNTYDQINNFFNGTRYKNVKLVKLPIKKLPDYHRGVTDILMRQLDNGENIAKKMTKGLPPEVANVKVKAIMNVSNVFTSIMRSICDHVAEIPYRFKEV